MHTYLAVDVLDDFDGNLLDDLHWDMHNFWHFNTDFLDHLLKHSTCKAT